MSVIYKLSKRLLSLFVAVCIILIQISFSNNANAYTTRLYGSDRYKTAVAISQKGWTSSRYAVIARGDDFPDALCAGPLAKMYNAPILLTEPWSLNSDVLAELRRLGVSNVFIIGGPGAISWTVENTIRNAGISGIERIYGSDRYETSVKIAEKLGWPDKVALATGENYPDALSISAIAAKKNMPILLSGRDYLPASVQQFIKNRSIGQTYIIGGTGVISEWVRSSVPGAVRLSGNDRFETNISIIQYFVNDLDFSDIYIAVGDGPAGDEFADALTGAVLAAKNSSPLILTGKTIPTATESYLKTKLSPVTRLNVLGGEGVVSSQVVNSVESYIGGSSSNVSTVYNTRGTFGPYMNTTTLYGDVLINIDGVTLQNTIINGNLILGEGIGSGTAYLRNVTVTGTTYVRGGGPNSIDMYDFDSQYMVVDVPQNNVRLVVQGDSYINRVAMRCGGRIEESGVAGNGFSTVSIESSSEIYLRGSFATVNVEAGSSKVDLENGSISTLTVGTAASNSRITLSSGTYVDAMTIYATSSVYGSGQIYRVDINADSTHIQTTPSTVNVASGVEAYVGGQYVTSNTLNNNYTVMLAADNALITIGANTIYYAANNISNPNGAVLTYISSDNSKVSVDYYTGLITSSTPGTSAVITVTGARSGWISRSVSFNVLVTTSTPQVTGVANGGTYSATVTPTWAEISGTTSTATLAKNGGAAAAYNKGTPISDEGSYVLTVTAASNVNGSTSSTAVSFIIDKAAPPAPQIINAENNKTYSTTVAPTWTDAPGTTSTATLAKNGGAAAAYTKGTPIPDNGNYQLVVTATKTGNGLTSSTTISFIVDKAAPPVPQVTGVENSKSYNRAVTPTWTDAEGTTSAATISKNGAAAAAYTKGTPIPDNGSYVLVVTATSTANNMTSSSTITFSIDTTLPAQPVVTGVENNKTYDAAVTPSWTDAPGTTSSAMLFAKDAGKLDVYERGTEIKTNDRYELVITTTRLANGLTVSTRINFIINIAP